MAPWKRARSAIAGDGETDDDAEHGEGPHRRLLPSGDSQARKRARRSLEEQSPLRDDPSSAEDEDSGSDGPAAPPQTQYEIMRDNGFKHLQYIDKDDMKATQKLKERPQTLGDNMIAESGIIESVTCVNFMCHEHLHVELGPLINFIVGENGSGKSAVLTALTLCLGGKASDTNRGGSLKSFVREGQDHGRLIVKIKNAGTDAYQHDVYGDSIIVERHFTRSGSSGFKIRNNRGHVISTKKQEVDEISEWYALQMGNPLTVLSQDNARQFLNSATPAQKYKYFISGVQLEQLDNDYKMSQDTLDKTLNLRADLDNKISCVKREMDSAQKLAETVLKNNSLREKARHYRNQLVWSQVVEQERELEKRIQDLTTRDERIAEMEAKCEEMSRDLISCEEKLKEAETQQSSIEAESESTADTFAAAVRSVEAAKKELTDLQREERDAFCRLQTASKELEAYQARESEEKERLRESTGPARAEKEAELSEAMSLDVNTNEQIVEHNAQLPVLQSKLEEMRQDSNQKKKLQESKRADVLRAQTALSELERSTGSPYDGFDREMMGIVEAVSNDEGFERKPLGPLGAHIRLAKPEWSGVLETVLGESLNAFVVRSKRDQSRLSSLIRRIATKKPPPIYIAYGGSIDTRAQEPGEEFDTILRLLEFDDELVRSQLVINHQIEKTILVPRRSDAEKIMIDKGPPRNVTSCVCFHDGQGRRGQGLRITNRLGSLATSPVRASVVRPRMQTDTARQIALQKDNVKHLGLELLELARRERLAQETVQKSQTEVEAHRTRAQRLANDLRRTRADIERIHTDLDAFEGVNDRLSALQMELETKGAEKEQLGAQYGNMVVLKREVKGKIEDAQRQFDVVRKWKKDCDKRLSNAKEAVRGCDSLRRVALSMKNHTFEQVDIERAERRRADIKCKAQSENVDTFRMEAEEVAPGRVHIPEGEDHRSIEKKYASIHQQLSEREAKMGATDQEIYDRANAARSRYEGVLRQAQHVDDTIASLKRAIGHRLHLWRQFQRQISARVRIQFSYLLSERGFRGKIDLDHRARKVTIHVEPDETRKSAAGRNTKTLSGGEKSFSSICMLLSVWEAIGSPIRCLDEFDVFMDNVNRAISTNMLIHAARRSVSRQYILITPNAIEGRARCDDDVKIIRLTDPRQRRLI